MDSQLLIYRIWQGCAVKRNFCIVKSFLLTQSWSTGTALSQLVYLHNPKKSCFYDPAVLVELNSVCYLTQIYPGSIAQILVPLEGSNLLYLSYLGTILSRSNENSTVRLVSPRFELTTSCIWYRISLLAAQTAQLAVSACHTLQHSINGRPTKSNIFNLFAYVSFTFVIWCMRSMSGEVPG